MSEHDFEPIRGLPGILPKGETIVWQGAPNWWRLAQEAFHIRAVAAYFAVMFAWRIAGALMAGTAPLKAFGAALWATPIAMVGLGLLAGLAWLYSRTTIYTITSKRVVMRFGVALPKAINIPFTIIESGAIKPTSNGAGDLALTLKAPNKIAFLQLWPNVRPWRLSSPQPSMRALTDVDAVAGLLVSAMEAQVAIERTRAGDTSRDRAPAGVLPTPDTVAA
jgi:hypothetical protein